MSSNNKKWRVKVIDAQGHERSQWTGYAPNKMFARVNAATDGHRLRIGERYTVAPLNAKDLPGKWPSFPVIRTITDEEFIKGF